MACKKVYTLKRAIKETQDPELLYHNDAQRCSHYSSLSAAEPFVPLSKGVFVFLRMNWHSLSHLSEMQENFMESKNVYVSL